MDFDAILQQLASGPTEEQKRQARAQALAAAGFGILGANAGGGWPGAVRAAGRGGLLGMNVYNSELANQSQAPMQNLEMLSKVMGLKAQQQSMDDQQKMRDLASSSMLPGAPGAPEMGPPTAQGQMQPAVPPSPPSFDWAKYSTGLAGIDPVRAMQVKREMAKDSPLDKPKPENYTAASLARFAQTRNFGDLEPITKPDASPMGKVNPADFTPASVAKFFQTKNFGDLVPIDKRAVTNVSVKNISGDAEGKVVGEWRGQTYADIQKAGANSYGKLNKLNAIERTLAGIDTNKLTPVGMAVAGPLRAAGIDIDPNLGPKEAADSVVKQMALEMRNPSGGAGMPGAMSDADREFLLNTVPNLSQTPGGRNLIIEVQRRLARRDQEIAKLAREFRNKSNGFDERFYDELAQKFGNTDLFGDLMKTFKGNGLPPGVTVQRER